MKISIVIPCYNEEKTLESLVGQVLAVSFGAGTQKEIIIVNDGSKDKSPAIIDALAKKHSEVVGMHNPKNVGKSQTVKNGIVASSGDVVVIQDADHEYVPAELVELLDKMQAENLDVVYGNRFGKKNKVIYWQNYFGNKFLTAISNIFTYPRLRVWIPDMEVCYKMFKGGIAREIGATISATSNFGFEPEVTAKIARYKTKEGERLKLGIVPITYMPRSIAEGKKMNAMRDGIKALKEIVYYSLT